MSRRKYQTGRTGQEIKRDFRVGQEAHELAREIFGRVVKDYRFLEPDMQQMIIDRIADSIQFAIRKQRQARILAGQDIREKEMDERGKSQMEILRKLLVNKGYQGVSVYRDWDGGIIIERDGKQDLALTRKFGGFLFPRDQKYREYLDSKQPDPRKPATRTFTKRVPRRKS